MKNKILEILHDKQGRVKKNEIFTLLKSMDDNYLKVHMDFGNNLKNLAYNDLIEEQGDFIILTPKGKKIRTLEELQVYENEQERKEELKENNDISSIFNNYLTPFLSAVALVVSIYSIAGNNTETKELKSKIEHLEQEVKQLKQPKTQKKAPAQPERQEHQ